MKIHVKVFLFELLLTIFGCELEMEFLGLILILLTSEDQTHCPLIATRALFPC